MKNIPKVSQGPKRLHHSRAESDLLNQALWDPTNYPSCPGLSSVPKQITYPFLAGHGEPIFDSPEQVQAQARRANKRTKMFTKCFDVTFNPRGFAKGQAVLAADSDEDQS